ncbi:MAG: peptide deformylase [Candidatus Xenobium sp.]|nr:peptide deformylase [Burkholderiales bacterium]
MATLDIKFLPDPILRRKARPVSRVDARIQRLLDDMLETMYASNGVGLAAPQVGISQRLIVLDIGDGPIRVVNPRLTFLGDEEELATEGCLSVPGVVGDVWRSLRILVRGLDENGRSLKLQAEGFLARAFQHEVDHLDGVLFVDKASDVRPITTEEAPEEDLEEGAPLDQTARSA